MVHPGTGVGVVGPTSLAIQISLGENMKEEIYIEKIRFLQNQLKEANKVISSINNSLLFRGDN